MSIQGQTPVFAGVSAILQALMENGVGATENP
jgi:hypothetical protein